MKWFFIILFIGIHGFYLGQSDFNNYYSLQAKGPVPDDLLGKVYTKLEDRFDSSNLPLKNKLEEIKNEKFHKYLVHQLLNSGFCIYGDIISQHVQTVSDQLLIDNPLKEQLRFYTLKLELPFLYVGDDGEVLVSTGLISHLESDAQLAFYLAHSFAHVLGEQTINIPNSARSTDKLEEQINEIHKFTLEQELYADSIALELVVNAGFSLSGIESAFLLMEFLHLPFEEIAVSPSTFSSPLMYVPPAVFDEKTNRSSTLKLTQGQNDMFSNYEQRYRRIIDLPKFQPELEVSKLFIEDKIKFDLIVMHCRFETMRSQVILGQFGKALYSIYVLKSHYPSSVFLGRMEAHCWLGLYQSSVHLNYKKHIPLISSTEGEMSKFYQFLNQLDKKAVLAFSTRKITDLAQNFSDDLEIAGIYKRLIQELSEDEQFSTSHFGKMTFKEMQSLHFENTDINQEFQTKTNKIKAKTDPNNPINFDSTKFYLYGISDLINNTDILDEISTKSAEFLEKNRIRDSLQKLSINDKKLRQSLRNNSLKLGADDIIIIEPEVYCYDRNRRDDNLSEFMKEEFVRAFEIANKALGKNYAIYTSNYLENEGTDFFNKMNILKARLMQSSGQSPSNTFPIDYEYGNTLLDLPKGSKVLYPIVVNDFSPEFSKPLIVTSLIFIPTAFAVLPAYVPVQLMKGQNTNIALYIFDPEEGQVVYNGSHQMNMNMNAHNIASHLYYYLKTISSSPKFQL
jgi:beta-barrel assembly-enhancing protease